MVRTNYIRAIHRECGNEVRILFAGGPDPGEWYQRTEGDDGVFVVFGIGTTVAQMEECGLAVYPGDKARLLNMERKRTQLDAAVQTDAEWIHAFNQVAEKHLSHGQPPPGHTE